LAQLGHGHWVWAGVALAFFYYASVQFRLRRFDRGGHSEFFEGLPSPVAAGVVVLVAISTVGVSPLYFVVLVSMVSVLMLSRIPYAHLDIAKKRRFYRVLKWLSAIFLVLTILKLLELPYARDLFAYELLLGVVFLYVLSPLILLFRDNESA
jgi:phosphatidylserine synthase